MINYVFHFLRILAVSLLLTIIFEEIIAIVYGIRKKMDFLLIICVNIITNPAVVTMYYFLYSFIFIDKYIIQIPLEIIAVIVEGVIYKKYGEQIKRPFIFAVIANVVSYLLGIVI